MKIDTFLKMGNGELESRLIETYNKQKLSGTSFKIARAIGFLSILLILIGSWEETEWFILLIWLAALAFEGYRFFNPNSENKDTLSELKQIAMLFENYKKCVTGEAEIELDEKQIKKATKQIERCLPHLLKNNVSNKIFAFIPLLSIIGDEMYTYNNIHGASHKLLKGGYFPRFTNENVKCKTGVCNAEKIEEVKAEIVKEEIVKEDIVKEVKVQEVEKLEETKEKRIRLYLNKEAVESFVGTPEKTEWYLSAFKKYNVNGIDKLSWNWSWPAFFFGGYYLLYRKCYLEGIILFIAPMFLGPFGLVINILFGGFLPYLYYKKFKRTALEVENVESDFDKQLQMLKKLGGVNKLVLYIGIGLFILFIIIGFLAIIGSEL